MAPVIRAMQNDDRYNVTVCATGQHQEMLFNILEWFNITCDYTLNVMSHQQPLAHLAGRLLNGLFNVIEDCHPDTVLVQGDTTSAFVGALATYYGFDHFWKNRLRTEPLQIAHIEAGLRTYNNYAPYPEELNRRLIGHMAHWNFAPTITAAEALYAENIIDNVFITGNTVIDALYDTVDLLKEKPRDPLPQIGTDERIILVTGHRRENYGEGFHDICMALKELAERFPKDHIVYPVHLNRHVQGPVNELLGEIKNIHLIAPLNYPDFVATMQRAHIILTDSGGVQEEAPSLGKPVLVMRDLTERPDAIIAGTVKIVGTNSNRIVTEASKLLEDDEAWNAMSARINPYGDGMASQRICNLMAGESIEDNAFQTAAA